MKAEENLIELSSSGGSDPPSYKGETPSVELNGEDKKGIENDAEIEEGQLVPEADPKYEAIVISTIFKERADISETFTPKEEINSIGNVAVNGSLAVENETAISNQDIGDNAKSGVKTSQNEEYQSSVHIKYSFLPRDSKRKLEEFLQQWSAWHSRYCLSSPRSPGALESGEETIFPAMHVGVDSEVSFWMDNQTKKPQADNCMPVDDGVPLYDRGFTLGLTSEEGTSNHEGVLEPEDASRCFNCGSYSHAMKDCPKPRNNAAVNSARRQLRSRRNQTAGSRNPSRYYQSSPAGKYEGLRPGVLDAETQQLLGLGELDPPPWLNRMREIGYPPGYLEPEDQDLPSGITIFDIEQTGPSLGDQEDGEILEVDRSEPRKKMSVKFPGINAPIPENADKWRWDSGSSRSSRNESTRDPFKDPFRDWNNEDSQPDAHSRKRRKSSHDLRSDAPSLGSESSSYPPRHGGNYENDTGGRGTDYRLSKNGVKRVKSPSNVGKPAFSSDRESEREGRSRREDSPSYGLYSSFSYPAPRERSSRHINSYDVDDEKDKDGSGASEYSSRSRDRDERPRHYSRR